MLPNTTFTYIERQVNSLIQIIFSGELSLTACVAWWVHCTWTHSVYIIYICAIYIHCIYFSYIDSFLIGVNPSNAAVEKY